jgi:patatin-like phospholipase/acyl hydrolase
MTPYYILSINGGGVRGIISIVFLCKLEAYLQNFNPDFKIYDFFDTYTGTSMGALSIAYMVGKNKTPNELKTFFLNNIRTIIKKDRRDLLFDIYQTQPKYSGALKTAFINDALGNIAYSAIGKHMVITAYDVEKQKLKIFNSAKVNPALLTSDVVNASSAAPCYYPCVYVPNCHNRTDPIDNSWFLDGGLCGNNSTMSAVTEVINTSAKNRQIVIINVGSGYKTRVINGWKSEKNGFFQWVKEGVLMDYRQGNMVEQQAENMFGECYINIDEELPDNVKYVPDDDSNLDVLVTIGEHWWEINQYKFENFFQLGVTPDEQLA